ncbi:MAG: hypothetical protein ACRERD_21675 [Candidatus Binatia bacterium]
MPLPPEAELFIPLSVLTASRELLTSVLVQLSVQLPNSWQDLLSQKVFAEILSALCEEVKSFLQEGRHECRLGKRVGRDSSPAAQHDKTESWAQELRTEDTNDLARRKCVE